MLALLLGHWSKRLPDDPGANLLVVESGKGVGRWSRESLGCLGKWEKHCKDLGQ